jgi:hypothetical protein
MFVFMFGGIALAVVVAAVVGATLRTLQRRRVPRVLANLAGKEILLVEPGAVWGGRQSLGSGQLRGSGVLVLTSDLLYYEMSSPRRVTKIPLRGVLEIETPRRYLGNVAVRPMLKVSFKTKVRSRDAVAWVVPRAEEWVERIAELCPDAEVVRPQVEDDGEAEGMGQPESDTGPAGAGQSSGAAAGEAGEGA